jgi:chromosomal replication initiator protein
MSAPDHELARSWPGIRAELERAVPPGVYQVWLERLEPCELAERTLVLAAPRAYAAHIAGRFARVLQTCAAAALGEDIAVDIVAQETPATAARARATRGSTRESAPAPPALGEAELNPKYTFDQFVIGEGNRLAHAAALAVAEQPGQAYNPLFIYGPPGLGKTHLLHSIARYLRAHGGGLTVRCTTADTFTGDFVAAIHAGTTNRFKAAYRGADVLLIDDVQFLEAKARTEEEFFHTFNALYDTGAQLVLTCDRLPRDIGALAERLRERFESGLLADIAAPDLDTRMAILRKRTQHDGLGHIDSATLAVIAQHIDDNIRALEGGLIRVVAFHSLRDPDAPLTPALATHVLDRLQSANRTRPSTTVRDIQEHTCETFGLTLDDLVSPSRAARVAWPRQLAMYLARELTDATLPAIGRQFGDRDHTTVLYAVRHAGKRLANDARAQNLAREVTARLQDDRHD